MARKNAMANAILLGSCLADLEQAQDGRSGKRIESALCEFNLWLEASSEGSTLLSKRFFQWR